MTIAERKGKWLYQPIKMSASVPEWDGSIATISLSPELVLRYVAVALDNPACEVEAFTDELRGMLTEWEARHAALAGDVAGAEVAPHVSCAVDGSEA